MAVEGRRGGGELQQLASKRRHLTTYLTVQPCYEAPPPFLWWLPREGSERGTRSHVPTAPPDFPTFIPAPPCTQATYKSSWRQGILRDCFIAFSVSVADPSYKSEHEMSQTLLVEGSTD